MIMNDDLRRMKKEVLSAYINVSGGTEENCGSLSHGLRPPGKKWNPNTKQEC
jgi:hypothetical protein